MLTVNHPLTRRRILSVGALSLGGWALGEFRLRQALAQASPSNSPLATGKSVIVLFQQGGPSQHETTDPKPDAPDGIRTVTGVTQTRLPGVLFGDTLPRLAERADKFTVVRSFTTGNAGHNIQPFVGPATQNAYLGAVYSSVVGATHPVTAMPTNAVLFPQAVDDTVAKGQGRGDFAATGPFGAAFAPFFPGGPGQLLRNLRLSLDPDRFLDRRKLLSEFDRLKGDAEFHAGMDGYDREQQQALEVLLSGSVANALDLSREDPAILARYDTSRFAAKHHWAKANRGKRGYYTGHAKTLGKALLLARRLCEAGCGFVTVHTGYEGVWDMHADGNNLDMRDGMQAVGPAFDHAIAAFIDDCESRGLSDRILLVATGEMGRTPKLNKRGGRDHWAKLAPLIAYGGGAGRGQVVGQSQRDGGEASSNPVTSENLIATLLHTVFDLGQVRLRPEFTAVARLGEAAPIPGLI